jgi:hypothetical protein
MISGIALLSLSPRNIGATEISEVTTKRRIAFSFDTCFPKKDAALISSLRERAFFLLLIRSPPFLDFLNYSN